jgi:undecaprenyl-diphosphatase
MQFDTELFVTINSVWTHPFADVFFMTITDIHKNLFVMLPLMILLTFLSYRAKKVKAFFFVLLISLGLADSISYHLLKKNIQRQRPAVSLSTAIVRAPFHSNLSFPSNHAANSFAFASTLFLVFGNPAAIGFVIAALIAYSRVYCGVHWPLDVLAGAILGTTVAFLVHKLFSKKFNSTVQGA